MDSHNKKDFKKTKKQHFKEKGQANKKKHPDLMLFGSNVLKKTAH